MSYEPRDRLRVLPGLAEEPAPPGADWLKALVWACLAALSVGIVIGVIAAALVAVTG